MDSLYISRQLTAKDQTYSEQDMLGLGQVFVVLAEPGAGKTELLNQLAAMLQVMPVRASIFRNRELRASPALVIDAMDEVARIDKAAVDAIIVRASDAGCEKVILAGRSSEWDGSRTLFVKECFGIEPVVVRLEPFSAEEQRKLFEARFPGEAFSRFAEEAHRMELGGVLGNPQFLQLFGEAYVEGGRVFTSKPAIFSDAVRRLAHEANRQVPAAGRPPLERIVSAAGEVFAKLLLSGASGVSTVESLIDRDYPYLFAFTAEAPGRFLTDTRLLKPCDDPERHEPVHRIVAEYCAARYLAARVDDAADRLSPRRLLSIVAPSKAVRTELRGMVGWMAALANERTQFELVDLDPYAVFANGDPSALTSRAKRRLLTRLDEVSRDDPYFRRGDVWRRFNVGQFFTADIRDEVASILAPSFDNISLRDLVVELISSSGAAAQFAAELRALALDPGVNRETRKACFIQLAEVAPGLAADDIPALQAEGSSASLEIAARATQTIGADRVGLDRCVALLCRLAELYPRSESARDRAIGSRYFIKLLIHSFDLPTIRYVLDRLTDGLACTCSPRRPYRCDCRVGISKIAGTLLDRYFEISTGPHEPARIRGWTKALDFRQHRSGDSSSSVKALGEDHGLRHEIQWLAVAGHGTEAETQEAVSNLFVSRTHSGIQFHAGDMGAIAGRAFEAGDVAAWSAVWSRHHIHDHASRSNAIRTLQRGHARQKADLMRIWALRERQVRLLDGRRDTGFRWRRGRRSRREAEAEAQSRAQFIANREEIADGRFGGWTLHFAQLFLLEPDKLAENLDYGDTPIDALRNCIPHMRGQVPSLRDLSGRAGRHIAQILLAHCIVRYREGVSLGELDPEILQAAFTEAGSWPAFRDDEEEERSFNAALQEAVFSDASIAGRFVTEFIEPALASTTEETPTHVDWLGGNELFNGFLESMPLDWLTRYPLIPLHPMESLFDMAVEYGDRQVLAMLIDQRFADHVTDSGNDTEADKRAARRHRFWALNAFFFSTSRMEPAWEELRQDRGSLLAIQDRVGWFGGRDESRLPPLSAEAIFRILDTFVGVWPKVPLPSSYGTSSPAGERAYRFLNDVVWKIGNDYPDSKLPVLERLLADGRFGDFRDRLLTLRAETLREMALRDFNAPTPTDISGLLDFGRVASVEDLRALLVEELGELQKWLRGSETDPLDTFYESGKHVDENTGRNRVVDRLNARMTALGLPMVIEHHMAGGNRCDFTATAAVSGARATLVVEVKGQWHSDLFTAASAQLNDRYAIHPDAAGQGIYLVFWFGGGETIAGRIEPGVASPEGLRQAITDRMPDELKAAVDVVVLDVSRAVPASSASPGPRARKKVPNAKATFRGKASPRRRKVDHGE